MQTQYLKDWSIPPMRIGQTLFNFFEWLRSKDYPTGQMGDRCADIFYLSDEEFVKLFEEYKNETYRITTGTCL